MTQADRAQLIFNASSGRTDDSAQQLLDALTLMQDSGLSVEVHMVRRASELQRVAREAVESGTSLIVVAGGDGTIDEVAGALVGTDATLGIIPIGTRNNLARSLGVPTSSVADAVALLREGKRAKIDVGFAEGSAASRYFLEVSAVGIGPALFPAADEIQRGDLSKIGDFLSTLVSHPPSQIHLALDEDNEATANAHMAFATNMPYLGANFHLASDIAIDDGLLDVYVFANLSKLDLVGYMVQLTTGGPADPRIVHYRVRRVGISSEPPMPTMADGYDLGNGPVSISVKQRALNVIVGSEVDTHLTQPIWDEPITPMGTL